MQASSDQIASMYCEIMRSSIKLSGLPSHKMSSSG